MISLGRVYSIDFIAEKASLLRTTHWHLSVCTVPSQNVGDNINLVTHYFQSA